MTMDSNWNKLGIDTYRKCFDKVGIWWCQLIQQDGNPCSKRTIDSFGSPQST